MTFLQRCCLVSALISPITFAPDLCADEALPVWDGIRLERIRIQGIAEGHGGLLARELFAQAVLIAARDEFGISTRDECLDESGPSSAMNVRIAVTFDEKKLNIGVIREGSPRNLIKDLDVPSGWRRYLTLTTEAESLSREAIPEYLKKEGLVVNDARKAQSPNFPPAVFDDVRTMSLIAQYRVLRIAHTGLANTPESLGLLCRAYSHLGLLTEPCWSAARDVFIARALLYAERFVQKFPNTATAYWHRAYVRALAGLGQAALEDLATATSKTGEKEKAPGWTALVEPFCQFDWQRLQKLAEIDADELEVSQLLACVAVREVLGNRQAFDVIRKAQLAVPYCLRILDDYIDLAQLDEKKTATSLALSDMADDLKKRLPGIPQFLPAAKKVISSRAELVTALQKAGVEDLQEPSWTVLSSLINEATFAQVDWRFELLHDNWGEMEMTAAFLKDEVPKLLAAHRWEKLFLARFLDKTAALPPPLDPVYRAFKINTSLLPTMRVNSNLTSFDLAWECRVLRMTDKEATKKARALLSCNPNSPTAIGRLLRSDSQVTPDEAADWEKNHSAVPAVMLGFAEYYLRTEQPDKATSYLQRFLKQTPEVDAYKKLAEVYRKKGDLTLWRETLLAAMPYGRGLEDDELRLEIAKEYMDQGEFKLAEPYVAKAAESYWAMAFVAAVECYEGLEDWAKAEQNIRLMSQRYESHRHLWHLWCRRTGRGDAAEALKLAKSKEDNAVPAMSFVALLDDRPDDAWIEFRVFFEMGASEESALDPHLGLMAAVAALKAEKPKEAEWVLEVVTRRSGQFQVNGEARKQVIDGATILKGLLSPTAKLDRARIDALLKEAPAADAERLAYVIGFFCEWKKETDAARAYYQQAAASKDINNHHRALASVALRELGPVAKPE